MNDVEQTVNADGSTVISGTIGSSSEQTGPTEVVASDAPVQEDAPAVQEDVKSSDTTEVKTVPYERFKSVNDQLKFYKELSETVTPVPTPVPQANLQGFPASNESGYDDAIRIVTDIASKEAQKVRVETAQLIELKTVMDSHPDFYQHADKMKAYKQANPGMSWDYVYKLATYDSLQENAVKEGEQKAYNKIQEKQKATVESSTKSAARSNPLRPVDPLARDPKTGKFLFSLNGLEDNLPRK